MRRRWLDDMAPRFVLLLPQLGTFTSDDLHAKFPEPPQRNWWGALVARMKRRGLIEPVGVTASKRREANGRNVRVWRATR